MYAIIQFADDDGSVAIVNNHWLTPRRCEVRWPPVKETRAFDRLLDGQITPDDKWKLYGVQRVFYATDDLEKAKKKLKLVEATSDLQTDAEFEEKSIKRRLKRTNRYISTNEEDEDDNHIRPPALKRQFLTKFNTKSQGTKSTKAYKPTASTQDTKSTKPYEPGASTQDDKKSDEIIGDSSVLNFADLSLSSSVLQGLERETGLSAPPIENSPVRHFENYQSYVSTPQCVTKLTGFQEQTINLLSHIKQQNAQILAMLKGKLETANLDPKFDFPIKNEDELNAIEEILKDSEKYSNLVNYIKSVGGRDLSNKVSRAMKIVLLDSVAEKYSFYGKRLNKKAFSELRLGKCLIDAVNCSSPGITARHVEDQIKVWLKHAPERNKQRV